MEKIMCITLLLWTNEKVRRWTMESGNWLWVHCLVLEGKDLFELVPLGPRKVLTLKRTWGTDYWPQCLLNLNPYEGLGKRCSLDFTMRGTRVTTLIFLALEPWEGPLGREGVHLHLLLVGLSKVPLLPPYQKICWSSLTRPLCKSEHMELYTYLVYTTHLSSSTLGFGIITLYLSFLNITPMNIFGHVDPTPKNPLSFF